MQYLPPFAIKDEEMNTPCPSFQFSSLSFSYIIILVVKNYNVYTLTVIIIHILTL